RRGFRIANLRRRAELAVFVRRLLVTDRQQSGILALRSGVELHPEQADGIDAESDRPLGKAGLVIEQKALRPLVPLRLAGTVLSVVGIEIEVAQFQRGLAIGEELRHGHTWQTRTQRSNRNRRSKRLR